MKSHRFYSGLALAGALLAPSLGSAQQAQNIQVPQVDAQAAVRTAQAQAASFMAGAANARLRLCQMTGAPMGTVVDKQAAASGTIVTVKRDNGAVGHILVGVGAPIGLVGDVGARTCAPFDEEGIRNRADVALALPSLSKAGAQGATARTQASTQVVQAAQQLFTQAPAASVGTPMTMTGTYAPAPVQVQAAAPVAVPASSASVHTNSVNGVNGAQGTTSSGGSGLFSH